jgi:hypothetical protein
MRKQRRGPWAVSHPARTSRCANHGPPQPYAWVPQPSPKLSPKFRLLQVFAVAVFHSTLHVAATMKISNHSAVPVYTISGSNTARPLPDWLIRKRKRSLKQDPEFANRVELLQDFEFEEASHCVRVSEDGDWVMSTGRLFFQYNEGVYCFPFRQIV